MKIFCSIEFCMLSLGEAGCDGEKKVSDNTCSEELAAKGSSYDLVVACMPTHGVHAG